MTLGQNHVDCLIKTFENSLQWGEGVGKENFMDTLELVLTTITLPSAVTTDTLSGYRGQRSNSHLLSLQQDRYNYIYR